jgi:CHAD domain-containing protein
LKDLGELRDAQVQRIFIEQQMIRFPFLVLLLDFLKRREQRLVKDVARKVHRSKSQKLQQWTLNLCRELASRSEGVQKQESLATDVFSTIADAFAEAADRCQSIDPANPETVHRTRVAFKKFRYMVEAVSPSFTGLGKRQLRRLGNYQRRMGALQDLEILEACLHEFLREQAWAVALFTPFTSYIRRRRGRTLRLCLNRASDLFEFWDPSANLASNRA